MRKILISNRCDRILWKSTVELESSIHVELSRPRNRVGQFFSNAFRPMSGRPREVRIPETRGSLSSLTTDLHPRRQIAGGGDLSANEEPFVTRIDSSSKDGKNSRCRSNSIPVPSHAAPSNPTRRATFLAGSPQRRDSNSSRWHFLSSLLIPSHNDIPPENSPASSPHAVQGDVVCLSYNTLDDRAMRQLEGRSDHRPVIGTYAIYV